MPTGTIKNKSALQSDIDTVIPAGGGGNITSGDMNTILSDMLASYENIIQEYTTVQRDALTPFEGQKIYNTTSNRLEYYSASQWTPMSQKETVAIDCSANPDYPEALVGDQYIVSVAGKIGGASGLDVYVGDIIYAINDNAGGTQAGVGASWAICHSQSATDSPTFYAEITLSSAEILNLFTVRKTLVSAPGAGKIILPIQFITNFTYSTAVYATNTSLRATIDDADLEIFDLIAPANANRIVGGTDFNNGGDISNLALEVYVNGGNPTAGSGTATVGVYYKIHTL